MSSAAPKLVAVAESRRFMIDCFKAVKVPQAHAEAQADLLVAADHRGHFSHGMNRLEMYINDLAINSTDGGAVPKILKETPATAWVDGLNGLGAVVGNYCMDLAIKKAKTVGVGWVCAKGSNHYGMAGWYAIRAMEQGLVGMSMTNTSPLMAPTRAKEAALGTNPLSLGANATNGDKFLLDMATTAVAVGKIEIQRRKGAPLPDGWAQDPNGAVTNDAELGFSTGCLMPLGGSELTSGYKGYGLGAMVDILTGVMSGANYSTQVRKWTHAGADSAADHQLNWVLAVGFCVCHVPICHTRFRCVRSTKLCELDGSNVPIPLSPTTRQVNELKLKCPRALLFFQLDHLPFIPKH